MTDTTSPALRTWLAYYQAWTNHDLDTAMRLNKAKQWQPCVRQVQSNRSQRRDCTRARDPTCPLAARSQ
jgi:hypothetical protein